MWLLDNGGGKMEDWYFWRLFQGLCIPEMSTPEGLLRQEPILLPVTWKLSTEQRKEVAKSALIRFEDVCFKLHLGTRWMNWITISFYKRCLPRFNIPTIYEYKVGVVRSDGDYHWIGSGKDVVGRVLDWKPVDDWDIQRSVLEEVTQSKTVVRIALHLLITVLPQTIRPGIFTQSKMAHNPREEPMEVESAEKDSFLLTQWKRFGFPADFADMCLSTLSQNLLDFYQSGKGYDVTILVRGETFRAHRAVLSARSPVLAAMFSCNMLEKQTGVISVDDCEPEAFRVLLHHLYTGRLENLTEENVLVVYYAADKYDLPELKKACFWLIETMLSVNSICDIILLSVKHEDKALINRVTEFYVDNRALINESPQWKQLKGENPTEVIRVLLAAEKLIKKRAIKIEGG